MSEDGGPLAIDVLANDSDPDAGTTLAVTAVTDPAKGSAAIDPGGTSVTYTPDPDANGTDTFDYTVSDGDGGSASASVTVTIAPVNDPPVAVDDTVATMHDAPMTIQGAGQRHRRRRGRALDRSRSRIPGHGTAVINPERLGPVHAGTRLHRAGHVRLHRRRTASAEPPWGTC